MGSGVAVGVAVTTGSEVGVTDGVRVGVAVRVGVTVLVGVSVNEAVADVGKILADDIATQDRAEVNAKGVQGLFEVKLGLGGAFFPRGAFATLAGAVASPRPKSPIAVDVDVVPVPCRNAAPVSTTAYLGRGIPNW